MSNLVLAGVTGLLVSCGGIDESAVNDTSNALAAASMAEPVSNGMVVRESAHDFDGTLRRLNGTLDAKGLAVVATLDHRDNAQSAGMAMRESTIVMFGNPSLGTPLMQSAPTMGIDLPQKMLVYEDASGRVLVAYTEPQWLARRHGVADQDAVVAKIDAALGELAETATR